MEVGLLSCSLFPMMPTAQLNGVNYQVQSSPGLIHLEIIFILLNIDMWKYSDS